jgi:hypothetical protein
MYFTPKSPKGDFLGSASLMLISFIKGFYSNYFQGKIV